MVLRSPMFTRRRPFLSPSIQRNTRYSNALSHRGTPVTPNSDFEISAEQAGAVRKRWLVDEFLAGRRKGAIWSISTRIKDFPLEDAQGYGRGVQDLLCAVRTDLDAFTNGEMRCLENHGYSLADAAMRSRAPELCVDCNAPFSWPHTRWCEEGVVKNALANSRSRRVLRSLWNLIVGE